ncbi:MAG TPA: WecB/TagA/CpsF family glycosyltransferase [Vicinamibacteria bacterium]|nr:WecB/TagA/CpsF family glycosyltransferase [Vicinamibacteria bacterium]
MHGEREVEVVQFGSVCAHAVSMEEAVDLIARRAASGEGGYVLTPNLDHIAIARREPEMVAAYRRVFLALADGMPLVAVSRLLRLPVREKVSGSDLFRPLMARCAHDRLPVFFVGATRETCEEGSRKLRLEHPGLEVSGYDPSFFDLDADPDAVIATLRRARDSGARLIVVCLPPRKQLLLCRFEHEYRPAVGIGAGSALSFYAGHVRRAPRWVSRLGFEWMHRLVQEPRRLWRRYLIEDAAAMPVLARMVLDRLRGRPLYRSVKPLRPRAE